MKKVIDFVNDTIMRFRHFEEFCLDSDILPSYIISKLEDEGFEIDDSQVWIGKYELVEYLKEFNDFNNEDELNKVLLTSSLALSIMSDWNCDQIFLDESDVIPDELKNLEIDLDDRSISVYNISTSLKSLVKK